MPNLGTSRHDIISASSLWVFILIKLNNNNYLVGISELFVQPLGPRYISVVNEISAGKMNVIK